MKALKKINLGGNQLSGSILTEIGQLKALTERLCLDNNKELSGALPVLPSGCFVDISGKHLSSVSVIIKPLNWPLDHFMIIQYVVLGYADLVSDILVIIELMTINVPIAVLNLFFIVLGIVLGYWNAGRTMKGLLLNVIQLSILVNGIETLYNHQTPGLVLSKKLDAVVWSMSSVILQLYSFLKDLDDYPVGTHEYNIFVLSIALGILGASMTLSGFHRKCGNSLLSWQFVIVNLYYISEISLRCLMISVAFISVRECAFIVAGFEIFLRGFIVHETKHEIDISLTCLYLGSDSALNSDGDGVWILGTF